MLATQIRQKDSVFYFCAYPSEDLLDKVRFISRFYAEGAPSLAPDEAEDSDEVAQFIGKIESSDAAFQRQLGRALFGLDQFVQRVSPEVFRRLEIRGRGRNRYRGAKFFHGQEGHDFVEWPFKVKLQDRMLIGRA